MSGAVVEGYTESYNEGFTAGEISGLDGAREKYARGVLEGVAAGEAIGLRRAATIALQCARREYKEFLDSVEDRWQDAAGHWGALNEEAFLAEHFRALARVVERDLEKGQGK